LIYIFSILFIIGFIYILFISFIIFGFYNISILKRDENNILQEISIVVAVRNEQDNILGLFNSINDLSYPKDKFEVIIINDNSDDDTEKLINKIVQDSGLNISYFNLLGKTSKKEALKLAISKAKYKIISTTDADCLLPVYWLKLISNQFNNNTNMLLGPVMFKKTKGFLGAFQVLDMLAIQGVEFGMLNYNKPILNNGANLSFSKNVYLNVGGYDNFKTPSGDDVFLLEKFVRKSSNYVKGILDNQFTIETNPEFNFRSFINQRLRWASKSDHYKNKYLQGVSLIIFLENISQIFIYSSMILVDKYMILCLILLLAKWMIDLILLILTSSFFGRKRYLIYFIPVQIIYPIYIVLVAILSKMIKYKWKGRIYK